ncbi:4579_t:CDS:2 [Acaulospora morrowiae]|uniref:4579_t:CDS:1 n=1 Tax=Acaulospora morrowiae TaxID=94023 RepID=A0A9N9EW71_9GLOM|nr:4579_t:CDS:2 [Acaulospora morrowiae]
MTFYSEVGKDFKQLYENRENGDVIVYAGEELKELRAHSQVLLTYSSYFRGMHSYEESKNRDGYFILKKSNISASTFEVILKLAYREPIDLHELDNAVVLKVLLAVDELGFHKLINYIEKCTIKNIDDFLREDPEKMLQIVASHETFEDFKEICVGAILTEPSILFGTGRFLTLEESTWMFILESDEFIIDEIEIWDYVIKWGIAQGPKLKSNVKDFEDQDFEALEKRLRNFIPLIRFHEISMANFYISIWPFKKILSEELVDNMLHYYMVPEARPRFNVYPPRISSILIKKEHIIFFANWIDDTDDYERIDQVPYSLRLLYRASRDGNKAIKFHQKCDKKGATIVVAKIEGSETLVGGYNSLYWDSSGGYENLDNSFIFLIKDRNNSDGGFTLGRLPNLSIKSNNGAIYNNSSYGPTFGKGHDLCCHFKSWSSNQGYNTGSYAEINLPSEFKVFDWEVFKVLKKS